jgi:hypothetical protein
LIGCDFSSRPTRRKPIIIAHGGLVCGTVMLYRLERLDSAEAFADWLSRPARWLGGFDLPFGLPRALVHALGWPLAWEACIGHYAALDRPAIRAHFKSFCDARPVGDKFAHRATDRPAGSSPSMKWVNPPVAYMLHAGVPALLKAGVHLPGVQPAPVAQPGRVALEAYPGLLAREVLGRRSYKSDDPARQTLERCRNRDLLLQALGRGQTRLGLRLALTAEQHAELVADGSGDLLDACLCLVQAAWASQQGWPWFGLPVDMDPLEGWIVTAEWNG